MGETFCRAACVQGGPGYMQVISTVKKPPQPPFTVRPWRPKLNSEIVIFWIAKSLRNNNIKFLDLSELKGQE
jgi:hypothetical protein